jgi:hypothetical protein
MRLDVDCQSVIAAESRTEHCVMIESAIERIPHGKPLGKRAKQRGSQILRIEDSP